MASICTVSPPTSANQKKEAEGSGPSGRTARSPRGRRTSAGGGRSLKASAITEARARGSGGRLVFVGIQPHSVRTGNHETLGCDDASSASRTGAGPADLAGDAASAPSRRAPVRGRSRGRCGPPDSAKDLKRVHRQCEIGQHGEEHHPDRAEAAEQEELDENRRMFM